MKSTILLVLGFAFVAAKSAEANCQIWSVEDTSANTQKRERVFAWSDLSTMEALVAESAGIARRRAEDSKLDFVDIFLTRPQDGTDRGFHNSTTTTVWMRYNPGGTPLINTTWRADALVAGAKEDIADFGMFVGERATLGDAEITTIMNNAPEGVSDRCGSP